MRGYAGYAAPLHRPEAVVRGPLPDSCCHTPGLMLSSSVNQSINRCTLTENDLVSGADLQHHAGVAPLLTWNAARRQPELLYRTAPLQRHSTWLIPDDRALHQIQTRHTMAV